MIFCPNCGKELPDGAMFCTGCGNQMQGNVGMNEAHSSKPIPWMVIGSVLAVVVIGFIGFLIFGYKKDAGGNESNTNSTSINGISKIKLISECTTVAECPAIKFGKYEQDNNFDNGKEDLEWIVLDRQGGKALITTKYIIDCKCYNNGGGSCTWENCTLRGWLNNVFYNTAFNDAEKKKIIGTLIENSDNAMYGTEGGNDTLDNVFCLSLDEANRYFGQPLWLCVAPGGFQPAEVQLGLLTTPTEYAKQVDNAGSHLETQELDNEIGVEKDIHYLCDVDVYIDYSVVDYLISNLASFWLRTPGRAETRASTYPDNDYVINDGDRGFYADGVERTVIGVRPALWIKY